MNGDFLVRGLFDGPIDIVGDVHGEIQALGALLRKLGYDEQGRHPEGRRLVFVGDLGDRGEDSPGVIEWVRDRVLEGRAQAVLGNHDLNALEAAAGGDMKTELSWLFDEARPYSHHGHRVPQAQARGRRRDDLLAFFATLPVALERGGDLPVRVVHAAWEPVMVERLRHRRDAVAAQREERASLERTFGDVGGIDQSTRKLLHQNCNAVKRLTSGVEGRSAKPIVIHDEPRWELRLPWWRDYADPVLCVVGHYWRIMLPGEVKFESLFDGLPLEATHGRGPVMCIDYSVGKRFRERMHHAHDGRFRSRLGALRLPEKQVFYDNAEMVCLLTPLAPASGERG
jgi:hypothetical protein